MTSKMTHSKIWLTLLLLAILILPVKAVVDSDLSNNNLNKTINVIETKSWNLTFQPIDNPNNYEQAVSDFVEFIRALYPISDEGLIINSASPVKSIPIIEQGDTRSVLLLFRLTKGLTLAGNMDRVVGVLPENWYRDVAGANGIHGKSYPFMTSVLAEEGFYTHVAAHELGHTFGLCDEKQLSTWLKQSGPVLCPNGDSDEDLLLDDNCTPQGCPAQTIDKLHPIDAEVSNYSNFMGANDLPWEVWISTESYNHLISKFNETVEVADQAIVIPVFHNFSSNETIIYNSFVVPRRALTSQEALETGEYTLELKDSSNNILANISYSPPNITFDFNGTSVELNESYMIFIMNYSEDLSKVDIMNQEAMVAEKNKSANIPTLSITSNLNNVLVNNNFTLNYDGADSDGDTLEYAVLVSSDNGSTYSTLEIDHPNESLSINTTGFAESAEYKIKILATDGINTNTTVNEGTFEIDNDLRITDLNVVNEQSNKKIFFYRSNNTLDSALNNISENFDTGEGEITFAQNHSLNSRQDAFVFIEYEYSQQGNKTLTAEALSGNLRETEFTLTNASKGLEISSLNLRNQSGTASIFEFSMQNNMVSTLSAANWTFHVNSTNVLNGSQALYLSGLDDAFVFIAYNFSNAGMYHINATAKNGSLQDNYFLQVTI